VKVGVVGTINRDTIHLAEGTIKQGWGGILYNLVALSHLAGKKHEIIPVCNVGRDCYDDIMAILKRLAGLNFNFIRKVPQKNNHCHLTYYPDGEKSEILKGGVPPLKYSDLIPLLNCDIVLINYISGRDISTRPLIKFRRNFRGKIYIDIHSSTLGKRKDGSRFLRRPGGWEKIVALSDYVQMNRLELAILSGAYKKKNPDQYNLVSELKKIRKSIRDSNKKNNSFLVVTDGLRGAFLCSPFENQSGISSISPQKIIRKGDATGCGDCFSAGFIAALLSGRNPAESTHYANITAGRRIAGHKIYDILEFQSD
jgi:sugar/nucleoside kinase (ribokinase family)